MGYGVFPLLLFFVFLTTLPICLAAETDAECFVELEIRYLDTKLDSIVGATFKQITPPECKGKQCCIDIAKPPEESAKNLVLWNTKSIHTGHCNCWFYRKPGCAGDPVVKASSNYVQEDLLEMLKVECKYLAIDPMTIQDNHNLAEKSRY
ncbi:hypothetical protein TWF225_010892 [Orbilia oligospora]|nr:hypothetical protein TWF225_010892 [Orbilia oligospora]KAF3252559.1 hypothetical protein TWF217_007752 [Orbilia oligospora]KAF3271492.1 hypothetical protein TWF128_000082 [Orbilia oligospora]